MISFQDQTVLVIAPHPDDEAFGCGGLIHRVKQEGGKVYVLYVTCGHTKDFSKRGSSTKEERLKELQDVARFFKIDGYRVAFPGNEYHLRIDTIATKDVIHEIERGEGVSFEAVKPTMVVAPSFFDYNQDHRAVNEAVIAATRPVPATCKPFQPIVLTYELPYMDWSSLDMVPTPSFFVHLSSENLASKIEAVAMYKSQMKCDNAPLSPYGTQSLAAARGLQCGANAAEAFFIKRIFM